MSSDQPLPAPTKKPMDPLNRVKKADAAYHSLRRSILLGHIESGDLLLEQRIAEQLNCSQGTVREAFLRLEQDGLVMRRGYRGTVVSTTSLQEVAQMVEIRLQIECEGIFRAVTNLDKTALDTLYAITEEMDEAIRIPDYYRCSELDRQFHMALFRHCGLPALEPVLNRCTLHIHRFTYWNAEDQSPEMSFGDQHRAILQVLQAGDPDAAVACVKAHIAKVIQTWAPHIGQEMQHMHTRSF